MCKTTFLIFRFLVDNSPYGEINYMRQVTSKHQICHVVAFIDKRKEHHSNVGIDAFKTHFSVRVMLVIENPTVTVK